MRGQKLDRGVGPLLSVAATEETTQEVQGGRSQTDTNA